MVIGTTYVDYLYSRIGLQFANIEGSILIIYITFAGSFTTYVRFIPSIKKHYDQGLIIFLVTFNLVMLGSYHDNNALHSAIERIYTVAIGGGICLIASLLILPNWSGEDLQSSIISKFEELAKLVQGTDC